MSKTTGRILMAMVAVLLVSNWFYARKAKASPQIAYGQPACWGGLVGSSKDDGVVFRDNSGTLRFVTNVTCETTPQVALEVLPSELRSPG